MTRPADFSTTDLLAWARTKPADATYNYASATNCAMCQFLRETGRAMFPMVATVGWNDYGSGFHWLPEAIQSALPAGTFGGLAEQLEALVPEAVMA